MTSPSSPRDSPSAAPASDTGGLILIGRVVRLQVQTSPLKQGERPRRWYSPDAITSVPAIRIDSGGVTGHDGESVLADVHHRDHPLSRFRGDNGVSVGFTAHYDAMRARFGGFLHDGIAGPSLLVASDRIFTEDDLSGGIVIVTEGGTVDLMAVQVAPPCVEFGKFCLRYPHDRAADSQVAAAVAFLHQGMRGFYATWKPDDGTMSSPRIAIGDLAYRRSGGAS